MPHVTFPTTPDGLVVDALIGLPGSAMNALQQAGQPIPPPILVRALLDTGADATSVSAACATRLALPVRSRLSTHTAGGAVVVNQYEISFSISGPSRTGGVVAVRNDLYVTEWLHPEYGL